MELAFDRSLVAHNLAGIASRREGESARMGLKLVIAGTTEVVIYFTGFGAKGTAQTPVSDGNLFNQHFFQDTIRIQLISQLSE
jgi:hypothetical protein